MHITKYSSTWYNIEMDEVFLHHSRTFEESDLNFQFPVLPPQSGSYGHHTCVSEIMVKKRITNKRDITRSLFLQFFCFLLLLFS